MVRAARPGSRTVAFNLDRLSRYRDARTVQSLDRPDAIECATDFAERIAPAIFGHDFPQTLLIHSNDITADALDRVSTGFEGRGYRFITLDEAMNDEAYRTRDTLVTVRPNMALALDEEQGHEHQLQG
jgi:hypothetical protein